MVVCSRLNSHFRGLQQDLREKAHLQEEIDLRDHILDHERGLNANIAGSITSGLLIIDLNGCVIMLNDNVRALLKLSAGEYIGSSYSKALRGKMRAIVEDFLKRVRHGPMHHEIKKISVDRMVIEIALYKMRDYHQNVNGVLMLINDITEQENTTQQLYRAEKLATMGTMLSGIAHELRNPLAIISARAQMALVKESWDRDWMVKNYQSIEAQTYRCATIINNLLDFTRYRATQMALHNLDGILDETLTYVEYQNSFDSITIEKQYQPDLVIYGDRSRFVQMFLNIISNASDAMNGKGNLTLRTRSEGKGEVIVEINDSGSGIDPSIKNNVFDPFFTTKEPGKGTGLGLAVVYKIIHESGGEVWFTSEPGNTTFFIKLPTGMNRV
jgi:PAS domain S-box-containing protein